MHPKKLLGFIFVCWLAAWAYAASGLPPGSQNQSPAVPFPPQFRDSHFFTSALQSASSTPASTKTITGLIVPHHLLTIGLMARAYATLAKNNYTTVVVLSPDHFNLGATPITVATRDFNTVFGKLTTDTKLVAKLLPVPGVASGNFFYREHGIGAELPFIKYYFPNAHIIALDLKEDSTESDLIPLIEELKKILPATGTLIIQSTDFSHYLPATAANIKDAETLKIMKAGETDKILTLSQPDHLDSTAALYVQLRLQKEFFGSSIKILDHKNSQDYTKDYVAKTTSYITAVFKK